MDEQKKASNLKRLTDKLTPIFKAVGNGIKKAGFAVGSFFKRVSIAVWDGVKKAASVAASLFRKKKPEDAVLQSESKTTAVSENAALSASQKKIKKSKKQSDVEREKRIIPYISKEHLTGEGKEHINMFRPRRHEPNFIVGIVLTSFKLLIVAIFALGAAGLGSIVGIAKAYMETTPTLDTGEIQDQSQTSYIYDDEGELITMYSGVENRDWATIDEIPEQLQNAVIAIEDVRFDNHTGVDVKRLIGAFLNNLMNSSVQGGSTITQQLIKNSVLSSERTYKRKIQEAFLALELEKEYTKDEILEAYMNTMHLGGSNYGVKAAAKDYFGKELDELSLRECAMLAGITQYPYKYNPRRQFYDLDSPDELNERTNNVLLQMYKASLITQEEYQAALEDDVYVLEESEVHEMYDYPHFVEYAVYDVITHLLEQRNLQDTTENRTIIDNEIRTNGYHIYTTIDTEVQETVQTSLEEWDDYPELEDPDNDVVRQKVNGEIEETIQPQAACVVIDKETGDLKAVVGSRETPTAKKTLNRANVTQMPVGSSIKPIAVYAPAIDIGYSDASIVPHLPVAIEGWDTESGYPSGSSSKYGPVSLRYALVNSLNSATAYTLMNLVTLQVSKNYLIDMGIDPSHIYETGAGLALGTSPITPIEMAGAYETIANSGTYIEPLSFTRVLDSEGNVILDAEEIREEREVFKESTAWLVTDMLIDAVDHGTGTSAQIEGFEIGGKTGTNQDVKGVFFAGISPYYTMTLWIGHDQNLSLDSDVSASNSSAVLWQYIMEQLLDGKEEIPINDKTYDEVGLEKHTVCSVSGLLATEACYQDSGGNTPIEGYFLPENVPNKYCDLHELQTICVSSGKIASLYCTEDESNTTVVKGVLFLPSDSIYWKLSDEQRNKYLPGAFHKLVGMTLEDLTPDMPEYYEYFCDIHTQDWYDILTNKSGAVDAANAQLTESNSVLSNPEYSMSTEHQNQLLTLINELNQLLDDTASTAGDIEQKTADLKTLTDQLVEIYTVPEPTPTVAPTEAPTATPTTSPTEAPTTSPTTSPTP